MAIITEIYESSDKFEKNKREIVKRSKAVCTNCGTTLGELIQTKKSEGSKLRKQKHKFICLCGGESFVINTEYDPCFLAVEGLLIESIDYTNGEFISKLGKTNENRDTDSFQQD